MHLIEFDKKIRSRSTCVVLQQKYLLERLVGKKRIPLMFTDFAAIRNRVDSFSNDLQVVHVNTLTEQISNKKYFEFLTIKCILIGYICL